MSEAVIRGIERVSDALKQRPAESWIIAYSGGKDSTALLRLFCAAAKRQPSNGQRFDVIYCDTGVENIAVDEFVIGNIRQMQQDSELMDLGFRFHVLKADIENRFFVKIIGRGYPPPTTFFRWCTKELRIKPVEQFIRDQEAESPIVALGTRSDESEQRKRAIARQDDPFWQKQSEGRVHYPIFAPLADFSVEDVWDAVFAIPAPRSISSTQLDKLYRGASGECPIIRAPNAPPCGSGRFGCWTCTVVRKDKSAEKLVQAGYQELQPYLDFRNWLAEFRNDPSNRWPHRRNGRPSPGPFTLAARRLILDKVHALETDTDREIINADELNRIHQLWEKDKELDDLATERATH